MRKKTPTKQLRHSFDASGWIFQPFTLSHSLFAISVSSPHHFSLIFLAKARVLCARAQQRSPPPELPNCLVQRPGWETCSPSRVEAAGTRKCKQVSPAVPPCQLASRPAAGQTNPRAELRSPPATASASHKGAAASCWNYQGIIKGCEQDGGECLAFILFHTRKLPLWRHPPIREVTFIIQNSTSNPQ